MAFNKALLALLIFPLSIISQITQTVKGKIVDKEIGIGLPGVIVQLKGAVQTVTTTDNKGYFHLPNVPVGRHSFLFTYTGYKPVPLNDVIVTSGKEMVLNVEMEESAVALGEIDVKASSDTDVVSTMQMSNMKSFSIEETERYPGSRNDPARMAANFAGVQGTNDSRNDIVVRGNSPSGLLWRMEEIDIPNPNHFAVPGTAGGPQTILNNKYLANSEFYTGAFPANYGNATGGVFDLKMRNGNNEKHERTFQFGILGTELAMEGPISKKTGASYLFTYRYSTLAMFSSVHFNIGTSAIPGYQDMGIRLNFPTKKAGVFSFSSIGGLSDVKIILSKDTVRPRELYGDQTRDQYFSTNMGVGILSHVYSINPRTVMRTSLAYGIQTVYTHHNLILRNDNYKPNDTLPQVLNYTFVEGKATLAWFIKSKIDQKNSIKAGFFSNMFNVDFYDQTKVNSIYDTIAAAVLNKPFKTRINSKANFYLLQPYITYVHKFNDKFSVNLGVFSQYLTLNNHYSIEPRASLRYQVRNNQVLSLSYGVHSQMQPTYIYFAVPDSIVSNGVLVPNVDKKQTNRDLDFSKAQHAVLGYDFFASKYLKLKTELYYQYLWNIPVYVLPSSVSLINRGSTFTRFFPMYTMINYGTGYNYGLELTAEKLFHKHYFFMVSGSLYNSKYSGSDGVVHNTDFNGNYMLNVLGGLEYNVGKSGRNILSFGTKFTYGGGKRYSPVNLAASNAIMDVVAKNDSVNSKQFSPYNRLDFRVSYKINYKKTGVEIAVDLLNVMNTKNLLAFSYSPDPSSLSKSPLVPNYQLGFLPLFYVRVDF
jgi:hypothetical protein